jgi:hypothetical protein
MILVKTNYPWLRAGCHKAKMPSLTVEDYINKENTIIEYNLNDVFADLQ